VPIKFTTKGFIELWRGDFKISQHTAELEAVERATADAEASGATLYELRYPKKEIDLSRLTRVFRDIDVTRPNIPTGLTATPVSGTQINLSWSAGTDPQGATNEAVTGVVGYKLYRDGSLRISQAGTTFSDTGLSDFTLYSYRVTALDAADNESFQSTAVTARTLDAIAPTAPVISAAAASLTITVTLATASTDAGSGVASYTLQRATNSGFTANLTTTNSLTSASFPLSVSGLAAATQYFFRLRAVDGSSNIGSFSAAVNATTSAANQPPAWASAVNQSPIVGVPYSLNLDSLCADPEGQPLTYTIVSGTLPAGLTQSGARGQTISGTPTTAASVSVTFRANDLG
jgi:chitodextrinase